MNNTAKQVLGLIDLTSLNDDDTNEIIEGLCDKANTKFGSVAAICIYPKFISHAKLYLNKIELEKLPIATVVNFPYGLDDVDKVITDTTTAISDGANEIDLVLPYQDIINGDFSSSEIMLRKISSICKQQNVILKVIIESGELNSPELIRQASLLAIKYGADFIKTSTGRVRINSTLYAARIMLDAIVSSGGECGFKAAGGIKSVAEAKFYMDLASQKIGDDYVVKDKFRFGASSLLQDILANINGESNDESLNSSSY